MGLTRMAIERPVFIFMLMVAAVLMGVIGFQSMRLEQNPDVQFGVVSITTVYPGADPDTIAQLITRKIEDGVSSVPDLQQITSSSQEGVSIVTLQFLVGTNMDVALNDVRSKTDQIIGDLPREAERPVVSKFDTTSDPVLYMVAKSDSLSNRQMRDLFDDTLKDRFARIPGVAQVSISGGEEREIQVQVRKDDLMRFGVGIGEVQQALINNSLNVPSGRIVEPTKEFSVRVKGDFRSVDEIRNMMLSIDDPGRMGVPPKRVRLTDIANVVDGNKERREYSRLDGEDALVVLVSKSKEGNAVEISRAIQRASLPSLVTPGKQVSLLEQIGEQNDIDFVVVQDQAVIIEESLLDLGIALFVGIFLVTLIVYVFLHNLRGTIIVGIAIPVCLLATILALWGFGFTLNNLSLLALALAIGVLVDDCIVVLENIYRHLRMGEAPVQAAISGRSEIGLAAIAITLADVVVFVPIGFMGGIVGQFFRPLGLGYAICVMLSLFVSFTVTPMLASRWYRAGEDLEHPKGGFARWFEGVFGRFTNLYGRQLEWALNHRWFVFIAGFAVLVATFVAIGGGSQPDFRAAVMVAAPLVAVSTAIGALVFIGNLFRKHQGKRIVKPRFILGGVGFGLMFVVAALIGFLYGQWKGDALFKFQFFPPSDAGTVTAAIELPPGSSLAETQKVVEYVERIGMENPDVEYVLSTLGTRGGGFGFPDTGPNYASVRMALHEKKALLDSIMFWVHHDSPLRTKTDVSVGAQLMEAIGRYPGATITVTAQDAQGFGAPVQMSFLSDDREALLRTVTAVRDGLATGAVPGVITPEISAKPGKPEFIALPDRARLASYGMSVGEVGQVMRTLYEGDDTAKYRVKGREYDIRVMMSLEDRNNPNLLSQVPVRFSQGQPITLNDVTVLTEGLSVDKIDRRDKQEEIRVSANLLPGFAAGTVQAQIDAWMAEKNLIAEGVRYLPAGQADLQAREGQYLFNALFLGLILVYMLLASLFNNLLYPFIIQLAQPQAMVGAILALVLTDKTLNIVGFIGIITLVGLVGKNAILLVDYANTLRSRGYDRHDALVQSGKTRIRPIMMTTLAVVLGMLPVALAIGRGSEFRETIGITIIGGMILSTLLTLLVIPCSYTIFDDLSTALGRRLNRYRGQEVATPLAADGVTLPAPDEPTATEPSEKPR